VLNELTKIPITFRGSPTLISRKMSALVCIREKYYATRSTLLYKIGITGSKLHDYIP